MDRLDDALLLCGCATLLLCISLLVKEERHDRSDRTPNCSDRRLNRPGGKLQKKRPFLAGLPNKNDRLEGKPSAKRVCPVDVPLPIPVLRMNDHSAGIPPEKILCPTPVRKKKKNKNRPDGKPPKKRRVWVKDPALREHNVSIRMLFQDDGEQSFKNLIRMDSQVFEELLDLVRPLIERRNTIMRMAIAAEERLAVTLRYLATGDGNRSLAYYSGISTSAISHLVPETCRAIHTVLMDKYVKAPASPEDWKKIADGFYSKWNLPNCIGVLDGKHIKFKSPNGTSHSNMNNDSCITLMALVDADYNFINASVDSDSSSSDCGIFNRSALKGGIESKTLCIPEPCPLPGTQDPFPFYFVADKALPLKSYLMKPINAGRNTLSQEERIYNYRIDRAVRVVQNTFGMLASAFGVYSKPIMLRSSVAQDIVLATVCLHNFQRAKNAEQYTPKGIIDSENTTTGGVIPGAWRSDSSTQGWEELTYQGSSNPTHEAKENRNKLCQYVNSDCGSIQWQSILMDE